MWNDRVKSRELVENLRSLHLAHLRVDLRLTDDSYATALHSAAAAAASGLLPF